MFTKSYLLRSQVKEGSVVESSHMGADIIQFVFIQYSGAGIRCPLK